MPTVYPKSNLPDPSINWGRTVENEQANHSRMLTIMQQEISLNNSGITSSMGRISQQVAAIQAQVNLLNAFASVQYAEFTNGITGGTGFYASPASVSISSPTGRLEVGYGGSLNGGTGYFVYSITGAVSGTIVNRASVQSNPAQRVAVAGGAAFAPSGYKNVIVSVPMNETLTVALEIFSGDSFTFFFGGSIQARVSP